jgi:hypothetical protein
MFGLGTNHNRKSAQECAAVVQRPAWWASRFSFNTGLSLSHLRLLLNLHAAGAWFGSVLVCAGEVRGLLYYKTPTSPYGLQIIPSFTYRGNNPDIGARTLHCDPASPHPYFLQFDLADCPQLEITISPGRSLESSITSTPIPQFRS